MLVFDFFAGTGSATLAFERAGHKIVKVELSEKFNADERDIMSLSASYLIDKYGQPDFVWASPPCQRFSVATIGKNWNKDYTPKNKDALDALRLVDKTISLINELKPKYGWLIENPRGMLRKLRLQEVPRHTVTYCQYGDTRQKPTDLWGYVPKWTPKQPCKPKSNCHESAPRGSRTGTQGLKNAETRSKVPYELGRDICHSIEPITP